MKMQDLMPVNWFKDEERVFKNKPLGLYTPLYKMRKEMDNIFSDFLTDYDELWPSTEDAGSFFTPRSDVIETKDEYKVSMDMPGVEEKDVDVSLDNGVLKITGKKEHEKETKDAKVHRIERSYGSFKKTIQLPDNVLKDKVEAHFKNGVLKVIIPKTEESKKEVKKIKVIAD
jgi:HSP20 family protein